MVILGLGSNCGDRLSYLQKTIEKLKSRFISPHIHVLAISPIYESDALLPQDAPETWNLGFLNINVLCETELEPDDLLQHVKSIEKLIGRKDRGRWAPREIDIDILAMDSVLLDSGKLGIPHPNLLERPFAILPFADLLPEWKFPRPGPHFNKTAFELVSKWRTEAIGQIPFRTHRSHLCFTELVGVVNITPDSFSDGGQFQSSQSAIDRAQEMVSRGARILDLGAESTRPGAVNVQTDEEWNRLEPVIKGLRSSSSSFPIVVSIDTRNPEVARRSIKAGANWINDVTGFRDPAMKKLMAESPVDLVMMHSLTVPPDRATVLSLESDPVSVILEWAENRICDLKESGIDRDRIIFDPGLGFGKTAQQSWELLRGMSRFQELGVRILIGHSRKSFLTLITDHPAAERDVESLALSIDLAAKGVNYLRVHNTEMHSRGLRAWAQVNGISRVSP